MSRFKFESGEYTIEAGWDRPLATYFALVWRGGPASEGSLVCRVGCKFEELPTVPLLAERIRPYGEIPPDVEYSLRLGIEYDQIVELLAAAGREDPDLLRRVASSIYVIGDDDDGDE